MNAGRRPSKTASGAAVKSAWADITLLARNEWICWVTSTQKWLSSQAVRKIVQIGRPKPPLSESRYGLNRPTIPLN